MADMKIAENVEPLKKWDKLVKRNPNGQFERGSKALAGAGPSAWFAEQDYYEIA